MAQFYRGTVWFRRSVEVAEGLWQDTYSRRVFTVFATGVDDFKAQVIEAEHTSEGPFEFGPVGVSWAEQGRR